VGVFFPVGGGFVWGFNFFVGGSGVGGGFLDGGGRSGGGGGGGFRDLLLGRLSIMGIVFYAHGISGETFGLES